MHKMKNEGGHARYKTFKKGAKRGPNLEGGRARRSDCVRCARRRGRRPTLERRRSAAHAWKGAARGEAIPCNIIDMPFTNVGGYARCQAKERRGARPNPLGGPREAQLSFARQRSDFMNPKL